MSAMTKIANKIILFKKSDFVVIGSSQTLSATESGFLNGITLCKVKIIS